MQGFMCFIRKKKTKNKHLSTAVQLLTTVEDLTEQGQDYTLEMKEHKFMESEFKKQVNKTKSSL